jgi:hypothetical protein
MPFLTALKKKTVRQVVGFRCDCCGHEYDDQETQIPFDRVVLDHGFGYSSPCDMSTLKAVVCGDCILEIAIRHLPGARIVDHDGAGERELDREGQKALLARIAKRRAARTGLPQASPPTR